MSFFAPRVRLWGLIYSTAIWAAIGTVAGWLGPWNWAADLAAHFRPQYLVVLAPIALIELARRRFRAAAIFGLLAAANAAHVAPAYFARPPDLVPDGAPLRVLLCNVHTSNTRYDRVLEMARSSRADLVVLQEVDHAWIESLRSLAESHHHTLLRPQPDNFGMAIYSRYPLRGGSTVWLGEGWVPALSTELDIEGRSVALLALHTVPPWGRQGSHIRDDQLRAIPGFFSAAAPSRIVIGDFNLTPWSLRFSALLRATGLRPAQAGRGILPTWPAPLPALFRIPIDHVLVSPDLGVEEIRLGPYVGSDHLPLLLDLRIPSG